MKRIGIGVLLLVVVGIVFSTESILAGLRKRDVFVNVQIQDAKGVIATEAATAAPTTTVNAGATPAAGATAVVKITTLTLDPDGTVVVQARWTYKIGPTFPITTIRAQALNSTGVVVADDLYKINCGTDSLDCTGNHTLMLNYGVQNSQGTRTPWPADDYTIKVTRSYGDLKATDLLPQAVTVHVVQ
ncbi:MAG: hypothetical protein ABI947_26230 [Chloroflexota bacterium]